MASVKVAVRVRPFNKRELDINAQLIIQMRDKTTGILNCKANTRDESIRYKEFAYDYSYWSHEETSPNFTSQERVYKDLGTEIVDCAFEGYNACVFAYGQTGSGKTFTMMGSPGNIGLIPRICKALFDRMSENSSRCTTHRVSVSYLEIYQERVADLLRGQDAMSLKVREHPKKGPYVEGLTTCLVTNYEHIQECMDRGNSHRTTASTNMNDVSSRSHAIFTITFVQAGYQDGVPSETVSKIHLVDLAGSERADATGATGQRLKEGAHINKSLVTLGSVISALAESSVETNSQKKNLFIPYRDSVLTWLLKDSLGGNSKTIMIATISPADCNYGETLSTLRYANRAKNIINKPTVNEDPNVKLIRELRNEISKLKALMFSEQRTDMLAQLQEKEAREKELTEEWAEKWREAQAILREQRALGLRKAGPGVVLDSDRPHLVAIDDDPLSTGVTLYHLKEGKTTIGTEDADVKQDIELKGTGMEPHHCVITFENGLVTLIPQPGAYVMLNNVLIDTPAKLSQGCIIFLGKAHVFRFNDPAEAAELRKGERIHNLSRLSLLSWSTPDLALSMENLQLQDEEKSEIEIQRQNLEKEKEGFEKVQEEFEKKRKNLEEAQAKLEAEKTLMHEEHARQARELEENWRFLAVQQKQRELELEEKEKEIIEKRNELEQERTKVWGDINEQFLQLGDIKKHILSKLLETCQFVTSHANDFTFTNPQVKTKFQDIILNSDARSKSDADFDFLIDVLNKIKGPAILENLLLTHRKELADLQTELNKQAEVLSEKGKLVEMLDKKMLELIEKQRLLKNENQNDSLHNLKQCLSLRSKEELEEIEKRKQKLKLNLKKVNSFESPDSCATNYTSSLEKKSSLSSDTYHTATSNCSTTLVNNCDYLMSDSGVELRPSPRIQDESDLSSNEEYKVISDSQSTSSMENRSPTIRKRRRDTEALRTLNNRILQQKQQILRSLDGGSDKTQIDNQISALQELQKTFMFLKRKSNLPMSPASEHPLQDSGSPSPVKPLHTGSTSALYSSTTEMTGRGFTSYNYCLHRSMPSIISESDKDSIVTIASFCIRGAGSKTHYEYEVRICTNDDRWSILRRYSRFRDLHIAMKARYGEIVSGIPFPSKQLFANSENVAKSRKRQLEFYLRRLIEVCKNHPSCPLAYGGPVTKASLISFSPFFKRGVFENGKYGTS